MKILRHEPTEVFKRLFTLNMHFDAATESLKGRVGTGFPTGSVIKDFEINLNPWKGKIIDVVFQVTDKGYEICVYNALKNYSLANGMPTGPKNRINTDKQLFRMVVHENLDDSLIQIKSGHDAIEGFEDIVEDGDIICALHNLTRHDDLARKLVNLARIKSDMLGVVDQRDSVSYLEAQVDILTKLVLALHTDSDNPLIQTLKKADDYSVLNIKGEDALAKEFLNKKSWVRSVQKDYYEAKAKEEAAN